MAKTLADVLAEKFEIFVDAGLTNVGVESLAVIKNNVQDVAFDTGRLHDSISFSTITKKPIVGNAAQVGDEIEAVTTKYTLHIGTGCPYAQYIEFGSVPMGQGRGSAEPGSMRERFKEWAARHGFPETAVSRIINKVMKRGLPARPFMRPSEPMIMDIANRTMKIAIKKAIEALVPIKTEIEVTVGMEGTTVRRKS